MGLYNAIRPEEDCPCCNRKSEMYFQFKTACSSRVSFLQVYSVGDTMPWLSPSHKFYSTMLDLVDDADLEIASDGTIIEHAYGHCLSCKKALRARVAIKDLKILSLTSIEPDLNWPDSNGPIRTP